MAEAYGLTPCTSGLTSESKLSCSPKVQFGFVPNHSHHGGKTLKTEERSNQVATLKIIKKLISKIIKMFFSGAKRNGVFPLVMSSVAQQRGMMAGLVQELALKHNALTADQKPQSLDSNRGVFMVFVNNRIINK